MKSIVPMSLRFSIKSKILWTFVLLVLCPSVLVLAYCINHYSQYVLASIIQEKHSIMKEINKNISLQLSNFKDNTMTLYYNDEIRSYIDQENYGTESEYIQQFLSSLVNSEKNISSAVLDLSDILYESGHHYLNIKAYFDKHRKQVLARKGRVVWIPTETVPSTVNQNLKQFVLARAINSPNGNVGTLWIFFSEDFFTEVLKNDSIKESAEYYIVANDKSIITSNRSDLVGTVSDLTYMDKVVHKKNGYFYYDAGAPNEREIVVFSTSEDTGWTIVTVTLESLVFRDLRKIELMACAIFVFYLIFLIGAYILLSKWIFQPLEKLSEGLQFVSKGEFGRKLPIKKEDEIGMLSENYNYMADKISTLMQDIRMEEQSKNEERMKVLAMQIGPHFTYNTLNTIKWMAVVNKQENISKMIESLIRLMRSVTYHMNEEICVEEEMELLTCYIYIQKNRYMNFDVIYEVEEKAKTYGICKLILQPLVENAILYAFRDKAEGGLVRITICVEDALLVKIEDNGSGFDISVLEEVKKKESRPDKIGLKNVSERIRLNYGDAYGITIDSIRNHGTIIKMRLPLIEILKEAENG